MSEIIEEPIADPNPEIKTYKKLDGVLVIEKTHSKPMIHSESYNIKQIQAQIDKINGVIEQWEAKKVPLQAKIDRYNEL